MGGGVGCETVARSGSSVRVDSDVVHQHLGWEDGSPIRIPRPVAAYSKIQQKKLRTILERPRSSLSAGSKRNVHVARVVNVELDLSLAPDHAVGVPVRR